MKFTMDVAVFAATIATTFAQEWDLTASIFQGCYRSTEAYCDRDCVMDKIGDWENIVEEAYEQIEDKRNCQTDALSRLRDLTNDPNATIQQHLIPESQTNAYQQLHDTEKRVEDLVRFDVPHGEDTWRNHLFTCPPIEDEIADIQERLTVHLGAQSQIDNFYRGITPAFNEVTTASLTTAYSIHCDVRYQDWQDQLPPLRVLYDEYTAFNAELLDIEYNRDAAQQRLQGFTDDLTFTESYETLVATYNAKKQQSLDIKARIKAQEELIANLETDYNRCVQEEDIIKEEYRVQITARDQWISSQNQLAAGKWFDVQQTNEYNRFHDLRTKMLQWASDYKNAGSNVNQQTIVNGVIYNQIKATNDAGLVAWVIKELRDQKVSASNRSDVLRKNESRTTEEDLELREVNNVVSFNDTWNDRLVQTIIDDERREYEQRLIDQRGQEQASNVQEINDRTDNVTNAEQAIIDFQPTLDAAQALYDKWFGERTSFNQPAAYKTILEESIRKNQNSLNSLITGASRDVAAGLVLDSVTEDNITNFREAIDYQRQKICIIDEEKVPTHIIWVDQQVASALQQLNSAKALMLELEWNLYEARDNLYCIQSNAGSTSALEQSYYDIWSPPYELSKTTYAAAKARCDEIDATRAAIIAKKDEPNSLIDYWNDKNGEINQCEDTYFRAERKEEFVAKIREQERIINEINYELRAWDLPKSIADENCRVTLQEMEDAKASYDRVNVCDFFVSPPNYSDQEWWNQQGGYWWRIVTFRTTDYSGNYCPMLESEFQVNVLPIYRYESSPTWDNFCSKLPCLAACNDFKTYDFNKLLTVIIAEIRAALARAQASLVECNNLSLTYKTAWDTLTAELAGLEALLPGLYAAIPVVTEAQKVAEKAQSCPVGIPELEDRAINAELTLAEWRAKLAYKFVEYFHDRRNESLRENETDQRRNEYENAFNGWFDYGQENYFRTESDRRMLAEESYYLKDSELAFQINSSDVPKGMKYCVNAENVLVGLQTIYGQWDEIGESYQNDLKYGQLHGDLSGLGCNTVLFKNGLVEKVKVYEKNDTIQGISVVFEGQSTSLGLTDGSETVETYSFDGNNEWQFFGFRSRLDDKNLFTGLQVESYNRPDFRETKNHLDNGPGYIIYEEQNLWEASLLYSEAKQWTFVQDILETHVIARVNAAKMATEVADTFRASDAAEMQARIDTLVSLRDQGKYHSEIYKRHNEVEREDDDGITIALVVGIIVLLTLILTIVCKQMYKGKQGAQTREGKILVNESSFRSDSQPAGRLKVVDEK